MGSFRIFVSKAADKIRKLLSSAFDEVNDFLDDFGFVMTEYGDPLKEFLETSVLKIEAFSQTPYGQAALAMATVADPKLAMVITAYQKKFVPMIEAQRGRSLEDAAKDLLMEEVKQQVIKYVNERDQSNDWEKAIEAEKEAEKASIESRSK